MSETLISRSHRFKNLLNPLIWVAIAKAMWGDNLDQMKYQDSQKMSHHHKTTQIVRQYFFCNRRSFHFRNSKTIRNGPCMFIPQIACHELRLQISKSADWSLTVCPWPRNKFQNFRRNKNALDTSKSVKLRIVVKSNDICKFKKGADFFGDFFFGGNFFCFSVWGTVPCYLLHFGTKACTLLNFGAKMFHFHCSLIFPWF